MERLSVRGLRERQRKRIWVWNGEQRGKGEKGRVGKRWECFRGEEEVAGGAEGRVNSAPTKWCGRSEPGTEGVTPPPPLPPLYTPPTNPARSAQLCGPDSFRLLCARVCLDSPALLSQQLNNRWLKKASIQSGQDQKITPRKVHRHQTKHTEASHAHTCKRHGLSELHMLQMGEEQIRLCLLQTLISFAQKNAWITHSDRTHATTCKQVSTHTVLCDYPAQLPGTIQ